MQDTLGKCRVEYSDAIGITRQPATPLPKEKKMPFPNVDTKPIDQRAHNQKPKPETEGAKTSLEDKINAKNRAKSHSYKNLPERQRGNTSNDQISISDKKLHPPLPSSASSSGPRVDHHNPTNQVRKESLSPSPVKKEQVPPIRNGPVNGCGSDEIGKNMAKNKAHVNGTLLKPKHHNLPRLQIKKVVITLLVFFFQYLDLFILHPHISYISVNLQYMSFTVIINNMLKIYDKYERLQVPFSTCIWKHFTVPAKAF